MSHQNLWTTVLIRICRIKRTYSLKRIYRLKGRIIWDLLFLLWSVFVLFLFWNEYDPFGLEYIMALTIFSAPIVLFSNLARRGPQTLFASQSRLIVCWTVIFAVSLLGCLQVRFYFARPALNRLADRLERGEQISFPQMVGGIYISGGNMEGKSVWMNLSELSNTGIQRNKNGNEGPHQQGVVLLDEYWIYVPYSAP